MKNKHLFKFFIGIAILTALFTIAALLVSNYFKTPFCLYHFLIIVICFFIVTAVFHTIQIRIIDTKPKKFERIFLILTVSKILIYLAFLVVSILNINSGTKCFLISFLVLYLCYTVYEVSFLSSYLKNTSNS
jgi:hypothetical protein